MTPIPVPVRRRILHLYERGKSTREIAQWLGFCAIVSVCRGVWFGHFERGRRYKGNSRNAG